MSDTRAELRALAAQKREQVIAAARARLARLEASSVDDFLAYAELSEVLLDQAAAPEPRVFFGSGERPR